jgi:large subunit ribosomal protein L4
MAIIAKKSKDNTNKDTRVDVVSANIIPAKGASKKSSRKTKESKIDSPSAVDAVGLTKVTQTDDFGQVFNLPANSSLLTQYIRVYQANQRRGNAKTKTRGEVAGSGKKPWKQKGTGRSRVGSIRTPVWRHGGISHGPVLKDWSLNLPKKMKSTTFIAALSQKIQKSQVYTVDKLDLQEGRTKELLNLLGAWKLAGSTLIVLESLNPHLLSASSNLQYINTVVWTNINTYQLVATKNIVFEKSALEKVKEKYAKNN